MRSYPVSFMFGAALLGVASAPAGAGGLNTYAGGVGGIARGSVDSGCYTSGTPDELKPFFSGGSFPAGGIAACGLVGGLDQDQASTGTVASSFDIAPVRLGITAGWYTGQAQAQASYGLLQVQAQGRYQDGAATGGPGTYNNMVAAAKFTDTLTASSDRIKTGSAGFVRYTFQLSGAISAPGPVAYGFTGGALVNLQYMNSYQPVKYGWSGQVYRGSKGFFNYGLVPDGWTTTPGFLSGSSSFVTEDLPIVWGQSWDLTVGLNTTANGDVTASFMSGARLTGLQLFDSNHQAVGDFRLLAASGTDYLAPVPEVGSAWLLLAGLAAVGGVQRRRRATCAR